MKLYKKYNLIENRKVIIWLNVASILCFFLFYFLFERVGMLLIPIGEEVFQFSLIHIFLGVGLFILLIIIHELIHGLFFKLFDLKGKVKFGFKNGMAYATSPNSYYSKGKFSWICLAPFVLITLILYVVTYRQFLPVPIFVIIASMHAASCVGDFYWCYLLIRAPRNTYVEDTEEGMNLYKKE